MADEMRPMPDDFAPTITARADHGPFALGYTYNADDFKDLTSSGYPINGLRQALWQASEIHRLADAGVEWAVNERASMEAQP